MSNGYECSATACDKPVAWLVTRLGGGGTIAFCEDDFAPGVIYFLAADLGVDGGKLYAAVTRFVDREAAKAAKAQADGARAAADSAPAGPDEPPDEPRGIPSPPPMTDEMAGEYLDHLKDRQR